MLPFNFAEREDVASVEGPGVANKIQMSVPHSPIENRPSIAVVGGGISGLMSARKLSQQGAVVTLFEASEHLGGQIQGVLLEGRHVDVGAEAIHLTGPGMQTLVDELGLSHSLVVSNAGTSWLWGGKTLHTLPAGVGPSGPRRLRPVLESRVMTVAGLFRAALEPIMRHQKLDGDTSVGKFIERRFGRQVVDRLLDPILGSLHAGDVYNLSLRATTPELAPIADSGRSIMMSRRRQKKSPPMSFASWPNGLTTLVDHLLDDARVSVKTSSLVTSVSKNASGKYLLTFPDSDSDSLAFDGIVLAVPARIAADLLQSLSGQTSDLLRKLRYASVATTILAFPRNELEKVEALKGTGVLVPSSKNRLLKASTFLSTKWPHFEKSKYYFLRISSGRANENLLESLDDAALLTRLLSDLEEIVGISQKPSFSYTHRWPLALPQLEVGHLDLIKDVREVLEAHPGIALAGASYDGIGISACLRSGERAATLCLETVKSK